MVLFVVILLSFSWKSDAVQLEGVVTDVNGVPLEAARVRLQGSSSYVETDAAGRYTLTVEASYPMTLTAGKFGWYNHKEILMSGTIVDTIKLDSLTPGDDGNYVFQRPEHCANCHQPLVAQWSTSKHARATMNPFFRHMYLGTGADGKPAGQGFKVDFPNDGGDCADCHAPTAALHSPGNTPMEDVWASAGSQSVDTLGMHCDFCHKVSDVKVNLKTGINGSIVMKRPGPGQRDIHLGPYDDVTTPWMGGTYSPVFTSSAFCSGCHNYANRYGVIVDDTYDSWLSSPAAAAGKKCQDCHLRPNSTSTFASGIGYLDAVSRDTTRVYNHLFNRPQNPVTVSVSPSIESDRFHLRILVSNETGHKWPTGVTFRNALLICEATDGILPLQQVTGPIVPDYGGKGTRTDDHAGKPGKGYTYLTADSRGKSPAPSWRSTRIIRDERIPPGERDTTAMSFRIAHSRTISVRLRLIYRPVYIDWVREKNLPLEEEILIDTAWTVDASAYRSITSPKLLRNFPNPFNQSTSIAYTVPDTRTVEFSVYNAFGQRVRRSSPLRVDAGTHRWTWDGSDDRGRSIASGVYFVRMITGHESSTLKILLVK